MRQHHSVTLSLALPLAIALIGGNKLSAQKLANAPSEVMLAAAVQQQTMGASAIHSPQNTPAIPLAESTSGIKPDTAIPAQLTLHDAEQIAVRNNPRVHVSQLLARAEHQAYRETRSAYFPQIEGGAGAIDANDGSRMTLDDLRSTRLLTHAGGGVSLDQMLYDFGRTANLIASSKLREKAQNANALATQLEVVLITDQTFYNALEAEAVVRLAQQTVDTRNTTNRQIAELTKNKLRSDLDLAISQENVEQARLLLLDAQTQYQSDMNALTAVLGFDHPEQYGLVDDSGNLRLPPADEDALVQLAIQQRPDMMALDYDQQAAMKFSRAQREQLLPTINTTGVVGGTPVRSSTYFDGNWFGGIGVTVKVPIFNGFLYSAQASEANQRARAAQENLRDLRNRVVRDVRDAWLQTNTSYRKIAATEKFLQAANLGLNLAQERYKLGLSSIVELSQAQLAQTQASIENVNARFEYQLSLAALNYQIGNLP